MWQAFGEVLPQAAAVAVSPVPIVLVILMLLSAPARTNAPCFALGWSTGLLMVGLVAFVVSDTADLSSDPEAADRGSNAQVLLGLIFMALAVRQWRRRPRRGGEPSQPRLFAAVDSMSAAKAVALGLAGAIVNPKNLPLTLSAGIAISQSGATIGGGVGALVLFSLASSFTVFVPVALFLVLGGRTRKPLDRVKTWLVSNNSVIMITLFAVLGAWMLGAGLGLTST